jgi:hypothetical protein
MRHWIILGVPVVVVLGGIIAYMSDLLPESAAGAILAGLCAVAPAPYAGWRVAQVVKSDAVRATLIMSGLLLGLLCALPTYQAVFPGEARYAGTIGNENKTLNIGSVVSGAYEVTLEGELPEREGEVTAEYAIKLQDGESPKTLTGEIWRRFGQVRVGRSGTAVREHARTYDRHRIALSSESVIFTLDKLTTIDDLHVSLHKVWVPAWLFWTVATVLFLVGTALEGRFGTEQVRALVATLFSFPVAFAVILVDQVTPTTFVRPAFGAGVGALFIAICVGGMSAWLGRKLLRVAHLE